MVGMVIGEEHRVGERCKGEDIREEGGKLVERVLHSVTVGTP